MKLLVHEAERIQAPSASQNCISLDFDAHAISGDITLELVLYSDAVLRLHKLPAHAT